MDRVERVIRALEPISPYWRSRLLWQRRVARGHGERRVIATYVTRGATALDIGAARGHYTAPMMHLVGRSGQVHAFEPNPVNSTRLARLAKSGPRNLTVHRIALSDADGLAPFVVPVFDGRHMHGLGTLRTDQGSQVTEFRTSEVPMARLDGLLEVIGTVHFMKCDVEGHEIEVLRGAEEVIGQLPVILMEIEQRHHPDASIHAVFEWIVERGYGIWPLFDDGVRPLDDFDVEVHQTQFLTGTFQNTMPNGYVNNFLLLPSASAPEPHLVSSR